MQNNGVLSHCETRYFHNMKVVLSQCESKLIKELMELKELTQAVLFARCLKIFKTKNQNR